MGNFFRTLEGVFMISVRWSREEIAGWSSLRKTAYLLLPLLFYFLVHDGAEILLWAGLDGVMKSGSSSLVSFLTDNAYTVKGVINGLAILAGVAVIWRAICREIREGAGADSLEAGRSPVKTEKNTQADGAVLK